jgi:hypothetical protein
MSMETDDDVLLNRLEQQIRAGLGPESGLVDMFKAGEDMQALLNLPAGKALVADAAQRAIGALMVITNDVPPSVEREREAVLALRLNVCILRRMSAVVANGKSAEVQMSIRAAEADSVRPWDPLQ